MKTLYVILAFIGTLSFTPVVGAQSSPEDRQKLQNEISNLKERIKSSRDVKPKDLQRLTDLENQLQKSQFLNHSQSR